MAALITSVTGLVTAIGTVVGLFFHNMNHPPASGNGGSSGDKPG
jgi:hypothetical protein